MTQQTIEFNFDITENRHGGNAESEAAFKSHNRDTIRAAVLRFIKSQGAYGATAYEVTQALGTDGDRNTWAPRVTELAALGLIVKTDRRRITAKGCSAAVYCCPEFLDQIK